MKPTGIVRGKLVTAAICTAFLIWSGQSGPGCRQSDLDNLAKVSCRKRVAEDILKETKPGEAPAFDSTWKLQTVAGDLNGDAKTDMVMVLQYTADDTIVAVYAGDGGGRYTYLGRVGVFSAVERAELLQIQDLGRDILLLRERNAQDDDFVMDGTWLHGYAWNGKSFGLVLELPQRIQACWKRDENTPDDWETVRQTGTVAFSALPRETIRASWTQDYWTTDHSTRVPPAGPPNRQRIVQETYVWDARWERFILGNAQITGTKESVAVLFDLADSVYSLTEKYATQAASLQVCYPDGCVETLDRERVRLMP